MIYENGNTLEKSGESWSENGIQGSIVSQAIQNKSNLFKQNISFGFPDL